MPEPTKPRVPFRDLDPVAQAAAIATIAAIAIGAAAVVSAGILLIGVIWRGIMAVWS